jgi:hypothetical protein
VIKGGQQKGGKARSHYPLGQVKSLVASGRYVITYNAQAYAYNFLGWKIEDIESALMKLEPKHFYKSELSKRDGKTWIDYYKAFGLMGENVYLHFHVDEEGNRLILASCKRI